MPLRCPEPLSYEEWKKVMENLERGQTPEQRKIMEEAKKWSKYTKVPKPPGID